VVALRIISIPNFTAVQLKPTNYTDFLHGHFVIKFCKKKIPQRTLNIFRRYVTTTHNFRTLA